MSDKEDESLGAAKIRCIQTEGCSSARVKNKSSIMLGVSLMANGFASKRSRSSRKIISCAEASAACEQLQAYFGEIEDPRVERTRAHVLSDILIMGILAVIAGAKGWEDDRRLMARTAVRV